MVWRVVEGGTNTFNHADPQTAYFQSPTGGISGGSVTGYSGGEYLATAVYNQSSFNLSTPGGKTSTPTAIQILSLSLFRRLRCQHHLQVLSAASPATAVQTVNLVSTPIVFMRQAEVMFPKFMPFWLPQPSMSWTSVPFRSQPSAQACPVCC